MADDIEQILEKVESQLFNQNIRGLQSQRSSTEKRCTFDPLVCQLLDDMEAPPAPLILANSQSATASNIPPVSAAVRGSKCFPLLLGAALTPPGLSSLQTPRVCDRLVCTSCDRKVVGLLHSCWLPSIDSLFLRQAAADPLHLRAGLAALQGARAYACQCCSLTVTLASQPVPPTLPWVCGRH